MNKSTKYTFICGLALLTFFTAQQTVKADTESGEQQIENVSTNTGETDQTSSISSQDDSNADTSASQESDVSEPTQQSEAESTNTQTSVDNQTTSTQSDANSSNIEHIKGVVVTHDRSVTYLYDENGSQVRNRGLKANTSWIADRKLSLNGATYYRVATNEFTNSNDVDLQYGNLATGDVRVKQSGAVNYARNEQGFVRSGQPDFAANSIWKYNRTDDSNGLTYYQIGNNTWINSNDSTVAPAYQNPNGWLQIQDTQIKPSGGAVGYDLYNGVEGIKTYLVRKYFGYSNAHTVYDGSVAASVRSLQANKGLPVTGVVDLATWRAMGFAENSWYGIDSYVAPLQTNITSSRSDHIEAMINQAYKYLGQPWISGAASSPDYGVDCSGLVTQALYASGIDPAPISNIQHAQPGNEWNCRMFWNDDRIPHVNFNDRRRGDLIFFTDPSTGAVWHVGILLDASTMIESWPFAVQEHSIYSGRGNILGVKRVFS